MKKTLFLLTFLLGCVLTGCDKLDDSDDQMVAEMLPGTWVFSYELKSERDIGMRFNYEQVIFREDGTCAITYPDGYAEETDAEGNITYTPVYGALQGTYQASSSVIRIVSEIGGEEQVMLWRILSLSAKQVVAEYEFELNGQQVTATVTLNRL